MCGFAGIFTARDDAQFSERLKCMQNALVHRGPDDQGLVEIPLGTGFRLGFVHTRLAILDRSDAGHQPMHDAETGSWIAYNGEVYNHQSVRKRLQPRQYRSNSDTETILQGWITEGEQILTQLRGMFAFALYDGRRRKFWLVRDRLGVKPLYVSQVDAHTWVFGSELRALLASGLVKRHLNADAIPSYLSFGAFSAPLTPIEGVESLLPGEAWNFDIGRAEKRATEQFPEPDRQRYWSCPMAPSAGNTGAKMRREEAVEQVRAVLPEAVSLRMVSDVPVAVFLSGGIDSSGVVSELTNQGHKLHTVSVSFDEQQYDESKFALSVAQHYGTSHTDLRLRSSDVLNQFDAALTAYDTPSIDGLNSFFISQATRQVGLTVALSGLGGDELFAGYPQFRLQHRLNKRWARIAARLALPFLRLKKQSGAAFKLDSLLRCHGSYVDRYEILRKVLAPAYMEILLGQKRANLHSGLPTQVYDELSIATSQLDAVNAHSLLELSSYMTNTLLRDLDQMSMAHAVEVREPLIDHVLVETLAKIPGHLKIAAGTSSPTKGLFCDALASKLPSEVCRRRKMGFTLPWNKWFRNKLRNSIQDRLCDADSVSACGLNVAGVQQLWQGFLAGAPGIRASDIACILHLIHWAKTHQLEVASETPTTNAA